MDDFKKIMIEALKNLGRPIPFYVMNSELIPLVKNLWLESGITDMTISDEAIGRSLKQMGYKRQKVRDARGWIIDKI